MVIGSRQRLATFDNHELRVTVDSEPVRQVTSTKTLGLTLDENLTWKNHIEVIYVKNKNSIRSSSSSEFEKTKNVIFYQTFFWLPLLRFVRLFAVLIKYSSGHIVINIV